MSRSSKIVISSYKKAVIYFFISIKFLLNTVVSKAFGFGVAPKELAYQYYHLLVSHMQMGNIIESIFYIFKIVVKLLASSLYLYMYLIELNIYTTFTILSLQLSSLPCTAVWNQHDREAPSEPT